MVVLAAAVTTKNGKALLSRQFVDLTKARIEGLLAAFPKLMGSEKQHTFIETESVRYVYQPLESLYVLLLTNKSSNILEDLESLHLLAKIVPEYCHLLEEREVIKNAFDIVFAFDEAIAMGYKERVNIQQIKHFTSMESNDEIRYKAEEKAKIMEAKRQADRQRKAIEKKRMEDKRHGISSEDMRHITNSSQGTASRSTFANEPIVETKRESPKVQESRLGKGLQLGGKTKKAGGYSQILKEEDVVDVTESPSQSRNLVESSSSSSSSSEKVHIAVSEKIALVAENDGGLQSMEVKGELIVTVFDANYSKIRVHVNQTDNKDVQFKSHPNMNKNLYTNEGVLALKDASKSYPPNAPSSIVKWRLATKDEDMIPLTISVWPSASGSKVTVPVEYEKKCPFDLADVVVTIPVPAAPVIGEAIGSCDYDARKGLLYWRIPLIDDESANGSMEFTVPGNANTTFSPVHVTFKSNSTYSEMRPVSVTLDDGTNQSVPFSQDISLTVEQYDIE